MKRVFVWALSAMVAIAVVGLAIAVQGNDSTIVDGTVVDVPDQQTVDVGTQALMELYQVTSQAEVQQIHQWQSQMPDVRESLTATAGNRFATAFIEISPEWKLVIRITGDTVPSVLANAVANAPIPVEVRTRARHTAVQLDALVSAVSADLSNVRAQVYVGRETGAIVVELHTGQAIDFNAIESDLRSKYDVDFEFYSVTIITPIVTPTAAN